MKTICFGLLVVFVCNEPGPVVVSDFCKGTKPIVEKLRNLTEVEVRALSRPRREAILALRTKYRANCK